MLLDIPICISSQFRSRRDQYYQESHRLGETIKIEDACLASYVWIRFETACPNDQESEEMQGYITQSIFMKAEFRVQFDWGIVWLCVSL
jgi:hypothetical protein